MQSFKQLLSLRTKRSEVWQSCFQKGKITTSPTAPRDDKQAFTLVEIMIVVAIIALIAAIGIPNLMRAKIQANEDNAIANLRAVAVASENYTNDFAGNYPVNMTSLTGASTPYVDIVHDRCGQTNQGYTFSCTQSATGYTLSAAPVEVGVTGNKTFTMTTGVVLVESTGSSTPTKSSVTDANFQNCLASGLGESSWDDVTQETLNTSTFFSGGSLSCVGQSLTDLAGLGNLSSFTGIYLHNNDITEIPDEISYMEDLTFLVLAENPIETISDELWKLDLTYLDMNNTDLSELPSDIGQMTDLGQLILTNNDLTEVPAEIGDLSSLGNLVLQNNDLTSLPPEIGNLSTLDHLNLKGNNLSSLPAEVGNLTDLDYLYLRDNSSLASMPTASGGGIHLTLLDVRNTGISCAAAATAGWTADTCYE